MAEKEIGKVTHYFSNISVAAIEITEDRLNVGDAIHIKGAVSDFEQEVESMQINKEPVEKAEKGLTVGIKVTKPVKEGDTVYKIIPEK